MFKKGLQLTLVVGVMVAASSMTFAHQTGSIGAGSSEFDHLRLFPGLDPETNPPGPKPPPKLDGLDPETNPPGPKPPPR